MKIPPTFLQIIFFNKASISISNQISTNINNFNKLPHLLKECKVSEFSQYEKQQQQQVNNFFSFKKESLFPSNTNNLNELKSKMNEKCENRQEKQTIHLKENDNSDSVLEKIEDIKHLNDGKLVKVSFKKLYIMKEMNVQNLNAEYLQQIIDKYQITRMLTHKNVLKTYDILINDPKLPPSILFEYCPKNLEEEVLNKKLTKVQKVITIYQIAEGMKYIHSHKFVHLNLIPSNILISDNGMVKIAGFERIQMMSSIQQNKEIEMKEMEDIYSFGNIVYFILTDGGVAEIRNETVLNSIDLLGKQLIEACWSSKIECMVSFEIICDVLEKNNYNLISLSQQEINELLQMINQYKLQF